MSTGTDPLDPDSDDDGLLHGLEIDVGADPLEPDGDGDGVLDGLDLDLVRELAASNADGFKNRRAAFAFGIAVDSSGRARSRQAGEGRENPALPRPPPGRLRRRAGRRRLDRCV